MSIFLVLNDYWRSNIKWTWCK